jgi:hypothetical protein
MVASNKVEKGGSGRDEIVFELGQDGCVEFSLSL